MIGHFHPPTGINAGPYTRAYTTDSVGHMSSLNSVLWLTFGEGVWPKPLDELRQEPPRLVLHHEGDVYFVVAQKCWLAAFEFHPPQYLLNWLKSRTYPFSLIATAERAEGGAYSWHASEILATTYQDEDFALGTSEGDWGFQAEECFLQYRLHRPVRGVQDIRTGYSRFLIDDDVPGKIHSNHNGLFTGEKDWLTDHGRYHTIQHEGVAMVLISPNLRLADKPFTKLTAAFILPEHLTAIERIEVADGHVWLKDGPVHVALRPLGATTHGDPVTMRVEKVNRYRVIWMPNYVGPSRTFSRHELSHTVNGFVLIVSSDKHESFDSFRKRVTGAKVLDYHSSGARTVRYQLGDLQMGINYGVYSSQVRYATINGKVPPRPVWQATGLSAETLPFLNAPPTPNGFSFPFKSLKVAAAPNEPQQIFSRGEE